MKQINDEDLVDGLSDLIFFSTPCILLRYIAKLINEARLDGRSVFWCGNGGSLDSVNHISFDITKEGARYNPEHDNKRLISISLGSNTGWITAIANDLGYEWVFVEQLKTLAKKGDLLVCVSGSGNSPNVLQAAKYAAANEMRVIGLTGFDGGKLKDVCDNHVHVDSHNMGIVESIHLLYLHLILNYYKVL